MINPFAKKIKLKYLIFIIVIINLFFFNACSPTKYLDKNEHLLTNVKINIDNKTIDEYDVEAVIKQKPVRKILGIAFHARIYNSISPSKDEKRLEQKQARINKINKRRSDRHDDKKGKYTEEINHYKRLAKKARKNNNSDDYTKYNKKLKKYQQKYKNEVNNGYEKKEDVSTIWEWVREIGEKPVIYDTNLTIKSAKQIKLYLRNRGYYNAKVSYKVKSSGKRKNITYNITTNKALKIDTIIYKIQDSVIRNFINNKYSLSIINQGNNLDIDKLQKERKNITTFLRNKGFYRFSREYIHYSVDTLKSKGATLYIEIKQFRNEKMKYENHHQYQIDKVHIYSDFDPQQALSEPDNYYLNMDTSLYKTKDSSKIYFINKNEQIVKEKAIIRENYIFPDSLYSQESIEDTYRHLTSLKVYKLVNIELNETGNNKLLNCNIQLTPNMLQSYTVELEGTNSSGNIGAAGNLTYTHRNLFRSAGTFDLKIRAAVESQKDVFGKKKEKGFNTQEYGFEARVIFPRLLAPSRYQKYSRKYNPKTSFNVGFNYQDRPDYTRIIINSSLIYNWKSGEYTTHVLTPIRLSSVRITNADSAFLAWLDRLFIKDSYEDHFIAGSMYSFVYNNQKDKTKRNFVYLRVNTSWAGNSLYGIMKSTNQPLVNDAYQIPVLETNFAQFIKADIDFRYFQKISKNSTSVYRIFAGIGFPFGNAKLLPFGEQYFSGGANSIRAWQVRSIGPGSFMSPDNESFPNQTADFKLEANFEYRFKLFWVIESAVFLDMGNIWTLNKEDNRAGAYFDPKKFYKEFAIGTGIGARLDFSFFIFRFDFGLKLYDPSLTQKNRWLTQNYDFFLYKENWSLNLGIGYPF